MYAIRGKGCLLSRDGKQYSEFREGQKLQSISVLQEEFINRPRKSRGEGVSGHTKAQAQSPEMSEWKACLRPGAKGVWGIGAAVSSVLGMERGFSVCYRAVLYMYIWLLNVEGGIQNIP